MFSFMLLDQKGICSLGQFTSAGFGGRERGNRNAQSVFLEAGGCVLSSFGHMRQMGEAGFHQRIRVMEGPRKSWALVMCCCLFSEPKKSQVVREMNRL